MAHVPNPGEVVTGRLFSEPMAVETATKIGDGTWRLGLVGIQSERFRSVTLSGSELASLAVQRPAPDYQGDGNLLRLGIQAHSLGIAFEFDPYFRLSVPRVDPLPHQLQVIYEYMLKLPRVRFLLTEFKSAVDYLLGCLLRWGFRGGLLTQVGHYMLRAGVFGQQDPNGTPGEAVGGDAP